VHSPSARGIPITLIQNQLGSNALCFHHRPRAIIIVDVSSLACQDTLPPLTPSAHLHVWCFGGRPLGGACVHYCCCASVAQRRGNMAQKEHPTIYSIYHPALRVPKLTTPQYIISFPTRPANPNILSSPSHTALCGHDFFEFIPTVWRVPSVVEGTTY
jgi:hypothetical protein